MGLNPTFRKNVTLVTLGPVVATIISFLAEPWIARFWEPSLFGIVSYYNSILLMIAPLLFLRYDFPIVQSRSDRDAHNLLALSILIGGAMILLLSLLIIPIRNLFGSGVPEGAFNAFFIMALLFSGLNILLRFWFSRTKRFIHVSLSTIILQISFTLLLLIFGFLGRTSEDILINIRNTSYVICPILMLIAYFRKDLLISRKLISWKQMILLAQEYKRYPIYESWGTLGSIVAINIPIILIAHYWGQEVNGLYSKAFYLLYLVVLFVGDPVNRVLHKEAAEMINKKEPISGFIHDAVTGLFKITILPFLIVIIIGPELFSVFLGDRWMESGHFARYLSLWMFSLLLAVSLRPMFGLLNKQPQFTVFTFIMLVIRIIILVGLGRIEYNFLYSVIILSVSNFIVLMIQFYYLLWKAGVRINAVNRSLMNRMIQLIPLVLSVMLLKHLIHPGEVFLILMTLILALPYLYFYYVKNSVIAQFLLNK